MDCTGISVTQTRTKPKTHKKQLNQPPQDLRGIPVIGLPCDNSKLEPVLTVAPVPKQIEAVFVVTYFTNGTLLLAVVS